MIEEGRGIVDRRFVTSRGLREIARDRSVLARLRKTGDLPTGVDCAPGYFLTEVTAAGDKKMTFHVQGRKP